MKRILHIFLLLFVVSIAVRAEGSPNTLVIKLRSGETVEYLLSAQPKLTFSGAQLVVKSDAYEAAYDLAQLDRYYFIRTVTDGIDATQDVQGVLSQSGDRLSFSGLLSGTVVAVYSTTGAAVSSVKAGDDGRATLSLSGMPRGVYVVKYGNVSTKIQKR